MNEGKAARAWRLYLVLGVLASCGYFFISSATVLTIVSDVVSNIAGVAAIAAVMIGVRAYDPVRPLPWYLLAVGLLFFVAGDVILTFYEVFLGTRLSFPSVADALYLAFYPFATVGLLMIGDSRLTRRGSAGLVDPLIVTTGFGLLFWVYFMEPYILKVHAENPSLTPISVLTAVAYPSMDLLLLAVLVRTLVMSKRRPPAYRLLGASLAMLLVSDVVWTVAQAFGFARLSGMVDAGFLLFFALLGASALHPSMANLFEPVSRVEARLTRPRLALLAGASSIAPAVLALEWARGEPTNVPMFVACSATLFLLVVARMAGMMRAREQAADRERVLRKAGAVLAVARDREDLYNISLEAALDLLSYTPPVRVSLWVGPVGAMEEVAATEGAATFRPGMNDLPDGARTRFGEERSFTIAPSDVATPEEGLEYGPQHEVLVLPLRARGEPAGAMIVTNRVPLAQEIRNALEALGAGVALALENLQLIEEVRRTSVLKERQRLSHEIHDTLAQGFTSIAMNLSAAQLAQPEMFSDPSPGKRHLELARRTARESLAETRRLVWALRPEALDRHALPEALESVAEEWSEETGIEARVRITDKPRQLLPETEVALLRVAQEALANAHKHAGADRVTLTLSYPRGLVRLLVSDDGVGLTAEPPKASVYPQDAGGFGLISMRERIEQLDGKLVIESAAGKGTTLSVELPAVLEDAGPGTQGREREAVEEAR